MSHFVTIRTEILDVVILKETLSDLGFRMEENTSIRGYQGRTEKVELSVQVRKGVFLGFKGDQERKKI